MSSRVRETAPAVAVVDLSVSYGPALILDQVGFTLHPGEALALIGGNGTGKSTLLRCVAGMQEPTGGQLRIFGESPGKSVDFWRKVVASIESPTWYHGLTAREHLELVRVANGEAVDDGELDEVCQSFGLSRLGDRAPGTLSAGQRQRLLLAAAFVRSSRLLLLDEPERHLDDAVKKVVTTRLSEYVADGGALIVASHDAELVNRLGASTLALDEPE